MESCIYEGRVVHRRFEPLKHEFAYRLFMVYLDLSELAGLFEQRQLSQRRWSPLSFFAEDHVERGQFGGAGSEPAAAQSPLSNVPMGRVSTERSQQPRQPQQSEQTNAFAWFDGELRELVRQRTGVAPCGPIRLLTQLRCFGYYFSPLNLYYCYDADGRRVEAVVAEVSNTPWGERHWYVLWEGNRTAADAGLHFAHAKDFHVSPFLDMDFEYHWQLTEPSDNLGVRIENRRGGDRYFEATLALRRDAFTASRRRRMLVRFPWMTGQIFAAIYWQALQLWWKKCPYYPHPDRRPDLVTR
jgi:DUF1365 family protein